MRYNSRVVLFVLIFTLVLSLGSTWDVVADSKTNYYLFTLASKSGKFEGDRLILNKVPLVVYFTDRPVRQSGHISLEDFISIWDKGINSFKKDPPTAELSVYDENGDKHDVMIISNPIVQGETISFKVAELKERQNIPKSFEHATLFIDPIGMMFPSRQN